MGRFSLFLAVVLMISSFMLVTARFQSRQLYMRSDRLDSIARQLDTDWRRLQLERAELTRSTRIDEIARNELGLIGGEPSNTIYITLPGLNESIGDGQ